MVAYKRFLTMCAFVFLVSGAPLKATQYIDSYEQLKNYIEQVVVNLFYPHHEWSEIRQLQRDVVRKVDRNYNLGFFSHYYDQERVYQATVDEVVNFIADKAYRLKGERGRTFIRKEIIDRVSHMEYIPPGFLVDYIGQGLKEKLAHMSESVSVNQQQLYPSAECCVCYQDFDGSIEQVFLVPCGHDLCRDCCKSHFFDYGNTHCPKCRAVVNKERLREVIFAPAGPSRNWFD